MMKNLKNVIMSVMVLVMVICLVPTTNVEAASKWTNSITKTKNIQDKNQYASYIIEVKKTCLVTVTACGFDTGVQVWDIENNRVARGSAMPQSIDDGSWNKKTDMYTNTFKLRKGYYTVNSVSDKIRTDKVVIKCKDKNLRFVKAYFEFTTTIDDLDYYCDTDSEYF